MRINRHLLLFIAIVAPVAAPAVPARSTRATYSCTTPRRTQRPPRNRSLMRATASTAWPRRIRTAGSVSRIADIRLSTTVGAAATKK